MIITRKRILGAGNRGRSQTARSRLTLGAPSPSRMPAAVLLAGVTALVAWAPGQAWAIDGLQYATATSPNDSTSPKVLHATCPTGTRGIGGSADIGGPSSVKINSAVPTDTGFEVLASESAAGTHEDWFVVVNAVCAPSRSLPGNEYREAFSAFNSDSSHTATVRCSAGKQAIAIGGVLDSNGNRGQDHLVLTAVRPSTDLGSVTATGNEDQAGFDGNWRVKATAICITPVSGQRYAEGASTSSSTAHRIARAACPRGTKIHSGGFDLGTGRGQVHPNAAFVDLDLDGQASVEGVEVSAYEDEDGFAGDWRVAAFGICAQ